MLIYFQDLKTFVADVELFLGDLFAADFYQRHCATEEAFGLIERFVQRLVFLEYKAQDLLQLQELLEISIIECTLLPRCVLFLSPE